MTTSHARAQAADELTAACARLHQTGVHLAQPDNPEVSGVVAAAAADLVARLTQDADPDAASAACADLMTCLWPHAAPETVGRADWWRTPLGKLCAGALAGTDTDAVTHAVAADMLGVTRGSISQWVHRGTLARHADGAVSRAAVLRRLSFDA